MKKLLFLATMVAVVAACEKNSKEEPQINITPSEDVEAIDLGLSVKWANMNIGATKPEEYGAYFAWGETSPKTTYNWSTYKYMQSGKSSWEYITKYTVPDGQKEGIWYNGDTFIGDNKTTLDLADDAAHVNWGGNWRMPTKEEIDELRNNCTWTWTQKNGINGYKVKSPKDSIFLPASGHYENSSFIGGGFYGDYWSSSLYGYNSNYACYRFFFSVYVDWYYDYGYRQHGHSIRPVCE